MDGTTEQKLHLGKHNGLKVFKHLTKSNDQLQTIQLISYKKTNSDDSSKSSSTENRSCMSVDNQRYGYNIRKQETNPQAVELPNIALRPGHSVRTDHSVNYLHDVSLTSSKETKAFRTKQNKVKNNNLLSDRKENVENKLDQNGDKTSKFSTKLKVPNLIRNRTADSNIPQAHNTLSNRPGNERNTKGGKALPKTKFTRAERRDETHRHVLDQPTQRKLELCDFVEQDIIGGDEVRTMGFGPTKITYLDYVASGRPLRSIENFIRQHVMPNYANTHTEVSYYAAQTTKFREEAREIIKESVHATENDAVIFCGSGSTSAFHKIVLLGPYEHHSNILPWIEIKAKVIHIKQTREGLINLQHLEQELKDIQDGPKRTIIGSFSAASNVTGILTDTVAISKMMHKYGGLAFFDFACAAPYVEIDMNCVQDGLDAYKDAIFISTHKFLGGPQTPGILIAKKWVFRNQVPHGVGGGTVVFVRRQNHKYYAEPEQREEGGTPAIIESIRAGLVFKLKETFTSQFIMERETEYFQQAMSAWSKHPDLLILGCIKVERLPIFSLLFRNPHTGRLLHHDFVALVLNQLFGLQVRSGCACAALYGLELMGMSEEVAQRYEKFITESNMTADREKNSESNIESYDGLDNIIFKPGFVRLNLPFFASAKCINFIKKAILLMADHGWKLLPLFDFERTTGQWWYREAQTFQPDKSLKDISFSKEFSYIKSSSSKVRCKDTDTPIFKRFPGLDYDEIIERATYILNDVSKPNQYDLSDQTLEYKGDADELRWFMLPSEAADIIHQREVQYVAPEKLPFMPVALSEKLNNKQNKRSS
ncbi:cysteine desulfurase [Biomphalaria pfeifferi]|uniref:Cysteine desulfurase n=1 Tax=Biomphalaria pfeifferi TaxID=112525 RepID=A0AAD8B4D9_BIOPF|nr:cysteine desulfurase [Biomphalaria pfeifferi]